MLAVAPPEVVVVDDRPVQRRGLRRVLASDGFAVVGEAADVAGVRTLLADEQPALVVMALAPGAPAVATLLAEHAATAGGPRWLLVVDRPARAGLVAAARAGIDGAVRQDVEGQEIVAAARRAVDGRGGLCPDTVESLVAADEAPTRPLDGNLAGLTPQEQRVFWLVGSGGTNRQVAERLGVTEKTIKNYVTRIMATLHLRHRGEVAHLAARLAARRPPPRPTRRRHAAVPVAAGMAGAVPSRPHPPARRTGHRRATAGKPRSAA